MSGCTEPPTISSPPRNLVIHCIDTVRAGDIGAYGCPHSTSPNIDLSARNGVLYADAVAPAPWTVPSCASMMTGTLSGSHGIIEPGHYPGHDVTTIAETLQSAGFETACFTDNPLAGRLIGLDRGFDTYVDGIDPQKIVQWLDKRSTDRKPFYLYIHTMDPHDPYEPDTGFYIRSGLMDADAETARQAFRDYRDAVRQASGRLRNPVPLTDTERNELSRSIDQATESVDAVREQLRTLYLGEIRQADVGHGILKQALAERNLLESTHLVMLSDHGEAFGEHGGYRHRQSLHRELLHVPFIETGSRGIHADVFAMVNLRSHLERFFGKKRADTYPKNGVIAQRIAPFEFTGRRDRRIGRDSIMFRRKDHTIIYHAETRVAEVYDCELDPGEGVDLAALSAEVTREAIDHGAALRNQWNYSLSEIPALDLEQDVRDQVRALGYVE